MAFRSSPLQATYSLLGPRPGNQLHFLTFDWKATGDMKKRNAYACTRIDTTYLPILPGSVTYRHNVHVQSLRTCLFSSDAAQWWPGLWGCGQWVGHGLDTMGRGWLRIRGRGGPWGSAAGHAQAYPFHTATSKFKGGCYSPC